MDKPAKYCSPLFDSKGMDFYYRGVTETRHGERLCLFAEAAQRLESELKNPNLTLDERLFLMASLYESQQPLMAYSMPNGPFFWSSAPPFKPWIEYAESQVRIAEFFRQHKKEAMEFGFTEPLR